jgi:hypothetical protein
MNRHERRKLEALRGDEPAIVGFKLEYYARTHNFRVPDDVTTLEDMVRTASLIAEHKLDRFGSFNPFWLVDCPEGLVVVETANMSVNTGEDKDFLISQIREAFRMKHVHRFASAVEAWSTASEEQRPSQAPDRMEIVLIHGEDGVKVLGPLRDIVRSDDGKPHLTALEFSKVIGGGRFTGLLPVRPDRSESVH